jgi:O-antigen/teichoic acid export membrane protein
MASLAPRIRIEGLVRRARTIDTLLENSLYGIGITGVNSGMGFLFWAVATHFYAAHAIGLATALISAMTLVSVLANVGGGQGLVQRLPGLSSAHTWSVAVNTSLVICALLSLAASGLTLLVLPRVSPHLAVVSHSIAYATTLIAGIVLWSISVDIDYLFVAERSVRFGFVRNAAFSVIKLVLLVPVAVLWRPSALALFAVWTVASALALLLACYIILRHLRHRWLPALRGFRREVNETRRALIGNHFINLGGTLPMYALPLIVTARLGIVQNAWAYIGWMVGGFALVVSPTVSAALFAEGSHAPDDLARQVRRSLKLIGALFLPMILVVVVSGRLILGAFGHQYAVHSYGIVVVLAISAIPDSITNVAVVGLRVRHHLTFAAWLNVGMGLGAATLSWFLVKPLGVTGIAWAWLIAQAVGSVLTIAAPTVLRDRSLSWF